MLRPLLVTPHIVWLGVLWFAAEFVLIIAWFAALFTRRLPEGLADFLSKVLRYQARVLGYGLLLLTDDYPSFAIENDDYAIEVVTSPNRLNRAAVLFRWCLIVPSAVLSTLALAGAQLVSVVGWLLTLITGRLPIALWQANAAVLRYSIRAYAFSFMLTAEQPGGLLGDREALRSRGRDVAPLALPERPRLHRLSLSAAARKLVVLFIVLSVAFYVGIVVSAGTYVSRLASSYLAVEESHSRLALAVDRFDAEAQRCAIEGGLECLHTADSMLADAFDQFSAEVRSVAFPGTVDPAIIIRDARNCARALRRMARTPDQSAHAAAFADFERHKHTFDRDYSRFTYEAQFN